MPPSKGRVARVVDVPVGGRHSHASNYSRTIATKSQENGATTLVEPKSKLHAGNKVGI